MMRYLRGRALRVCLIAGAVLAIAGGVAYATIRDGGNVYTACMLKNVGTIRLIDPSLPSTNLMSHCTSLETQISWNQIGQRGLDGPQGPQGPKGDPGATGPAGLDGTDGTSVTSATLVAGDPNCPNGGSGFRAATGTTYACNGAVGSSGLDVKTVFAEGDVPSMAAGLVRAACPTGYQVTGGGFNTHKSGVEVSASSPEDIFETWVVDAFNHTDETAQILDWAVCIKAGT
jgi:hypothetical protein